MGLLHCLDQLDEHDKAKMNETAPTMSKEWDRGRQKEQEHSNESGNGTEQTLIKWSSNYLDWPESVSSHK